MKKNTEGVLAIFGLMVFVRIARLIRGGDRKQQAKELTRTVLYPFVTIVLFLGVWAYFATHIRSQLGQIPGPLAVYHATFGLFEDATYAHQILTSLKTVFVGFVLASLVAVPLGITCGMNRGAMSALNPLIQVFKPISPLAWLPIVTIVVSTVCATNNGFFEKSFVISSITVSLCSLWPTLLNSALGVDTIDKDYLNLAKVFQLGTRKKLFKIVLPASLPLIFTGLRISLGIGWMVLIATEMLAQNPGLGKFVWDEFQSGSDAALARIFVAVFTIGIIGLILDRIMLTFQSLASYSSNKNGG